MSELDTTLKSIGKRLEEHAETIETEEAIKHSVVLPFLKALGYDVFNPSEVIPEFSADAVGKRGEKVDYAISLDGEIKILIECKSLATNLEKKHLSQLFRYFTVTNARFAILTNGRQYRFYTDLEEQNKLDQTPFFHFDITEVSAQAVGELQKFSKGNFDIDGILRNAEKLKYVSLVKEVVSREIEEPSDDFVRMIAGKVYDGRVTASVREQVAAATKLAFREVIREAVKHRLSTALESTSSGEHVEPKAESDIETTDEEIQGMLTVRAIVSSEIDPDRVDLRDSKSYCAVLADDNNRKPICRLHFNRNRKYVGLFDGEAEERVPIEKVTDLFQFADRLLAAAKKHA
ncbi:type I restriction endonuclease [Salibaculum sp.]|uniref:type I restriction endonuclease n=1 Tax=Salibaculum sp. TaxID=2855480 RepID=UPI002B45D09D|nr:type I restriction endonuclease [Salibaculum sp.]HKL68534.1 type I restriction endonuclease [Salibaculum sp.]